MVSCECTIRPVMRRTHGGKREAAYRDQGLDPRRECIWTEMDSADISPNVLLPKALLMGSWTWRRRPKKKKVSDFLVYYIIAHNRYDDGTHKTVFLKEYVKLPLAPVRDRMLYWTRELLNVLLSRKCRTQDSSLVQPYYQHTHNASCT